MDNNLISAVIDRKVNLVESNLDYRLSEIQDFKINAGNHEVDTLNLITAAYLKFFAKYHDLMSDAKDVIDSDPDNTEKILAMVGISPLAVNRIGEI